MPGYSTKPLWIKLGLQEQSRYVVKNLTRYPVPDYLAEAPFNLLVLGQYFAGMDLVHLYVDQRRDLAAQITEILPLLDHAGAIWVSWPKKAAKKRTDITEDTIREVVLPFGLVDVKVCSVSDDLWSGLKLVVRKELR